MRITVGFYRRIAGDRRRGVFRRKYRMPEKVLHGLLIGFLRIQNRTITLPGPSFSAAAYVRQFSIEINFGGI